MYLWVYLVTVCISVCLKCRVITYVYSKRKTYLLCSVKTFFRVGLLKRKQNGLTANSLFLFLAFSLRFLELALSYRVASGEMRFLELAFLALICIILTEFCARRISGTKTDYS